MNQKPDSADTRKIAADGPFRIAGRSGYSIFSALKHIQTVCVQIFDWFNIMVPLGIVALIAPQIARLGPDVYVVLAIFAWAFFAVSALVIVAAIAMIAVALKISARSACAGMIAPLTLGAASRNTLVCIPLALETMSERFRVSRQACELYIPLGFTVLRFGPIIYFAAATLFMGLLLGRTFTFPDIALIAILSIVASFATIGVSGIAALTPLATVLRPFGLSYELAIPLMIILDPIASMIRAMTNVAMNCVILAVATGTEAADPQPAAAPAE